MSYKLINGMILSIFPYKTKFLGVALMVLSLPFAYLYFLGGKPEFFNIKIFAIVTTYLETGYFVISQTNVLDELAAVLLMVGISLLSFSKEKKEKDSYEILRIKALINALFFTIVFWLAALFFIYGIAIFIVSFFLLFILLATYNLIFRYYLLRNNG